MTQCDPPRTYQSAYKLFRIKNGKLYPPMVANLNNEDTPVGVWVEAQEGISAGLSVTGRKRVKSVTGGTLSYRPGWHLSCVPRASQFDRKNKQTGQYEFPKNFVWAKCLYSTDVDYQLESIDQGFTRTRPDGSEYKVEKYQHSLAGLHKIPKDGFYTYKTNPKPNTPTWIIAGKIKVIELLDDFQINEMLVYMGVDEVHRQGGDKTLDQLNINI